MESLGNGTSTYANGMGLRGWGTISVVTGEFL